MYKKRKKEEEKTYIHNSPAVPTYCINVAIIIMQKNIYLFNVTLVGGAYTRYSILEGCQ